MWALFAPRSFYDGFPGLGRRWVSVDGPYNEHLVRDVGALNLALVVVLVAAAITVSRPLVVTAALASLVWGVPHTLYHLFNRGPLSTFDFALSVGGLAFSSALPLVILATASRTTERPAGDGPGHARGGNGVLVDVKNTPVD